MLVSVATAVYFAHSFSLPGNPKNCCRLLSGLDSTAPLELRTGLQAKPRMPWGLTEMRAGQRD